MITTAIIVSLVSLTGSIYAVARSYRAGGRGPIGPQGPAGKDGQNGVATTAVVNVGYTPAPAMASNHTRCISCQRVVARYAETAAGNVCVNCAPLK